MAKHSILLLRVSSGFVFFWFGALKFWPGLSPAESLIRESLDFLPMELGKLKGCDIFAPAKKLVLSKL